VKDISCAVVGVVTTGLGFFEHALSVLAVTRFNQTVVYMAH